MAVKVMASSSSGRNSLACWTQRSLSFSIPRSSTSSLRVPGAIAALLASLNLLTTAPSVAGGLGGAWSEWLPSGATSPSTCLSRARQFLLAQRLVRVASDGTVAYGDINSPLNISVFMICSDLGDRILLLISSRDVSQAELQKIRTNLTSSFRNQP